MKVTGAISCLAFSCRMSDIQAQTPALKWEVSERITVISPHPVERELIHQHQKEAVSRRAASEAL